MFGFAQEERVFDDKDDPPLQMDGDDDCYVPLAGTATKAASKGCNHPQSMDESGRGPRRAIAEAIARPLEVQPSINITVVSFSK
jgi:hypothetical protein